MSWKKNYPFSLLLRWAVQWGFLAWCLFLGVQFWLFVRHFESGGAMPRYQRPPGVEGFLPIGALVSLKNWLVNGLVDPVHPAALVLFVTFVLVSLLARKAFCGWLCPVGTLSEGLWRLGRRLFGRNFRFPAWLDWPLRSLKYVLLGFFLKVILLDMPAAAVRGFLAAPYWAVSDVKMLHFFLNLSATAVAVLVALAVASLFVQNFWCRYLCPYGAWLGFFSMFSPARIRREESRCIDCGACGRACPSGIAVQRKQSVYSSECMGCLGCTRSCPEPEALAMRLGPWRLSSFQFAALALGIFALGVGWGMLSGNWDSALRYEDFQRLIPLAPRLGH